MTHFTSLLTRISCVLTMAVALGAQLQPWNKHPDGTTHWYQVVAVPTGVTWSQANVAAAKAGGYLATVTSGTENQIVSDLLKQAGLWVQTGVGAFHGPWIGGVQAAGAKEPAAGWGWSDLEPFQYKAWAKGKPDNAANADRMHLFATSPSATIASWADAPANTKLRGYVIEFSGQHAPRTVGLMRDDPGGAGRYLLMSPLFSRNAYLLDARGRIVQRWASKYTPGVSCYLRPDNGNLLRCINLRNPAFQFGGTGGGVEEYDWTGKLVWQFIHSSKTYCQHHDIELLPNGNILVLAWELKTKAESIAAGRNPKWMADEVLWPEKIIEVKPNATGGTIVWEWHVWDHLVQDFDKTKANFGDPAKHPELVDINFTPDGLDDWLHANAIDYNPELDQIMLSVRSFNEIWVIDHGTTTKEAAGHTGGKRGKGGDLLYRWGNPITYRAGKPSDQKLWLQHDAQWIRNGSPGAGNILIYNNGPGRTDTAQFSSVDELVPPVDAKGNYTMTGKSFGPAAPIWSHREPGKFYSSFISGAERLPNGNTMICSGIQGRIFEVTPKGKRVWEYENPEPAGQSFRQGDDPRLNLVFRGPTYAANFSGFKGKTLTPGEPLEPHATVLLVDGSTVPRRAKVGTTVDFSLRAASHPKKTYLVATSATAGLTPIDSRLLRIGWDATAQTSLYGAAPSTFRNYQGTLDAQGRAKASVVIPAVPSLAGLKLYTSFAVMDTKSRSGVALLSNMVEVELTK